MDVLELPRPVINFLRTMSKEMHRYSLCWDIYGGSESVTLTLTWKLQSNNNNEAAPTTTTTTTTGGETTDVDDINNQGNITSDAYTKRQTGDQIVGHDSGNSSGKLKKIGCGKLQLAKCGGGGGSSKQHQQQQLQHGKLDDLANRNIAQMNSNRSQIRNHSAESRSIRQTGNSNNNPSYKLDNYAAYTTDYPTTSTFENDDDEDYRFNSQQQQQQTHQSRRSVTVHHQRQPLVQQQQTDLCPDCPKCNNNNNNMSQPGQQQFDNRTSRKQQQQIQQQQHQQPMDNINNKLTNQQFNKKITRMVRGKSLESRDNSNFETPLPTGTNDQLPNIIYPHQFVNNSGDSVSWRDQQQQQQQQQQPQNFTSGYNNQQQQQQQYHHSQFQKPNNYSTTTTAASNNEQQRSTLSSSLNNNNKYDDSSSSKCHIPPTQNRTRPAILGGNYQNYESNIPISIQTNKQQQQQQQPSTLDQHTTTNDLESNVSAYFASIGCNYIDHENLPPSQQQQQQPPNNNNLSIGLNTSSQHQPIRIIQQVPPNQSGSSTANTTIATTSNPWIRRNYGQIQPSTQQQQQSNDSCQPIHHSIPISNTKLQDSIDLSKQKSGLNSLVCETSLFNRVERENILSIVESTTSSLTRQDPTTGAILSSSSSGAGLAVSGSNPSGYFYGTLQPTLLSSNQQASSNQNTNNTANSQNTSNKVTFDPNLEYI